MRWRQCGHEGRCIYMRDAFDLLSGIKPPTPNLAHEQLPNRLATLLHLQTSRMVSRCGSRRGSRGCRRARPARCCSGRRVRKRSLHAPIGVEMAGVSAARAARRDRTGWLRPAADRAIGLVDRPHDRALWRPPGRQQHWRRINTNVGGGSARPESLPLWVSRRPGGMVGTPARSSDSGMDATGDVALLDGRIAAVGPPVRDGVSS
jgi:hypothetical protein